MKRLATGGIAALVVAVGMVFGTAAAQARASMAAGGGGLGGGPGGGSGTSAAAPDGPAQLFLCYSTYQIAPDTSSDWTTATAESLFAQGYWQPWAVAGAGAVTIGGVDGNPVFHLVCMKNGARTGTGVFTDNNGDPVPAAYADTPGVYPVAQ